MSKIALQRVLRQVGVGQEPESDGEADQDLVPEQEDEVKEEQPKTGQPGQQCRWGLGACPAPLVTVTEPDKPQLSRSGWLASVH